MIGDKSKFITFTQYDGNSVRFGNNAPCLIKGKGSIKLTENRIAKIYDSQGNLIGKGDQTRSNLFYLDMEDDSCLVV